MHPTGPVISPLASAEPRAHCPLTTLSHDGTALIAADPTTGETVRLTPAAIYHYRHELRYLDTKDKWQTRQATGLAALDAAGLVMLDLPGEWNPPAVHDLMVRAGLPIVDGRHDAPGRVRAVLAGRAPGWRRLRGMPPSPLRKVLVIGAGVAGLALMVSLAYAGMWGMWRVFSGFGRLLFDLAEIKWLAFLFSPLFLFLRPITAPLARWRQRRFVLRGSMVASPGGVHLEVKSGTVLRVMRGREALRCLAFGSERGKVARLLAYRVEGGSGLFLLDTWDEVVHHIPGPWPPEDVLRFGKRQGLGVEVLRLSQEEYLTRIHYTPEATP